MKKFVLLFSLFQLNFIEAQIDEGQGIYDVSSCNFDNLCSNLIIDTSANNLWSIGNPHKIIFNSNIDANKVIITDTLFSFRSFVTFHASLPPTTTTFLSLHPACRAPSPFHLFPLYFSFPYPVFPTYARILLVPVSTETSAMLCAM